MKISIIGAGYVGLVTASCFAELGHKVTCIDVNKTKIKSLKDNKLPFFEEGLSSLLISNQKNGNLKFSHSYSHLEDSKVFFICVDTPNYKNGKPNLSSINKATKSLAAHISSDALVVIKSTVPIGTNFTFQKYFYKLYTTKNIKVELCSNPEFLREGSAIKDFMNPDRVIFGTDSSSATKLLKKLYMPLKIPKSKILFMSIKSAELTKYASNSFLATKISFINEISQIADKAGANIHDIKKGMGLDSRIGPEFLNSGIGFGGSCFPKDIQAILNTQKSLNLSSGIIAETLHVNERQLNYFIKKISSDFGRSFKTSNIAIWGAAFKKNSDDLRESVAIKLVNKISSKVRQIHIYDPLCSKKNIFNELINTGNITFSRDKYKYMSKIDAIIICTDCEEFHNLKIDKIRNVSIYDGKNMLNKQALEKARIPYYGIGV
jgi:UDPglucose 6-dehydrogenase